MSRTETRLHWIAAAVAQTGLGTSEIRNLDPSTHVDEAWARVCELAGLKPRQVAQIVANAYRLKLANFEDLQIEASRLVPEELAMRHRVVPVRSSDNTVVVATPDPLNLTAEQELTRVTARQTVFEIAPPDQIETALQRVYRPDNDAVRVAETLQLRSAGERVEILASTGPAVSHGDSRGPVAHLADLILFEAVQAGAQEIHILPEERGGRVAFRVGDELSTFIHFPPSVLMRVVELLRALAGIPSTLGGEAHAESLEVRVQSVSYEMHMEVSPAVRGDKVCIRITRPGERPPEASEASFPDEAGRELALVVDDGPGHRLLMRTVLKRAGFEVVEATDGVEALEILRSGMDFSVMILDLKMPRMSGLEVLRHVRSSIRTAGLPVIIVTASENPQDELELLANGADDYIHKPIDPPRMATRVQAVLRRSSVVAQ